MRKKQGAAYAFRKYGRIAKHAGLILYAIYEAYISDDESKHFPTRNKDHAPNRIKNPPSGGLGPDTVRRQDEQKFAAEN